MSSAGRPDVAAARIPPGPDETRPAAFVHESAYVDDGAVVGNGTRIWHFSHVMRGARIGRDCVLGQNVNIGSDVVIGNKVKIQNNVSVYDGVVLEDDVFCGPSMVFTNVINPRSHVSRKREYRRTAVGRGATFGANCTIVCGVTIGPYAFVGAGAVVTRDVPAFALVYGNPGRQMGWMCQCGVKLTDLDRGEYQCPACRARYRLADGALLPQASSSVEGARSAPGDDAWGAGHRPRLPEAM
jgi:UDP-2-acetamido-3-amino-2,3-dideoxy-glucuronate N-acetyltransferase